MYTQQKRQRDLPNGHFGWRTARDWCNLVFPKIWQNQTRSLSVWECTLTCPYNPDIHCHFLWKKQISVLAVSKVKRLAFITMIECGKIWFMPIHTHKRITKYIYIKKIINQPNTTSIGLFNSKYIKKIVYYMIFKIIIFKEKKYILGINI